MPHQLLTRHQRRSGHLTSRPRPGKNFETETSKSPRLENLRIMSKCFYKFSKTCHHRFEVETFANFRQFS